MPELKRPWIDKVFEVIGETLIGYDRWHYARYRRGCRILQGAIPGMSAFYAPVPFEVWNRTLSATARAALKTYEESKAKDGE